MNIRYRIVSLMETGFFYDFDFDYKAFDPADLRFYLSHEVIPHPEEDELVLKMEVLLAYGELQQRLAGNSVALRFHFDPAGAAFAAHSEGSFSTRYPDIFDSILQAAVGTLRGTLLKNLKGTPLEPYPLPLISLSYFKSIEPMPQE